MFFNKLSGIGGFIFQPLSRLFNPPQCRASDNMHSLLTSRQESRGLLEQLFKGRTEVKTAPIVHSEHYPMWNRPHCPRVSLSLAKKYQDPERKSLLVSD